MTSQELTFLIIGFDIGLLLAILIMKFYPRKKRSIKSYQQIVQEHKNASSITFLGIPTSEKLEANFIQFLKKKLEYEEEKENYKECTRIKKLINLLESPN